MTKEQKQSPVLVLQRAIELMNQGNEDYLGLCVDCLSERPGTEPDATFYDCQGQAECGNRVFGLQELILCGGDISYYEEPKQEENK